MSSSFIRFASAAFFLFGFLIITKQEAAAQCPSATIHIDILTDLYPDETSWQIVDQNTSLVIATGNTSGGLTNSLYSWDVCVVSTGCYTFTIFDSYGDGICCLQGFGSYTVTFNGTSVGTGGAFTSSETISSIGGCSGACPDATVTVQIVTDNYPDETSWQLVDRTTSATVASGNSVGQPAGSLLTWNACVSSVGCYDFTIFDSAGDGICCGFGNGSYSVYLNGSLRGSGGAFTSSDNVNGIGNCSLQGTPLITNNTQFTKQQLVTDVLLGSCVEAFNISYTGAAVAAGYFTNGQGIGMASGVLLTSGNTNIAPGPNTLTDATFDSQTPGDAALETAAGVSPTFDATVLEFDFISFRDTVTFNYIFASEEYPEFVCSEFNDAFAFLVTGPGYAPNTNIARIPGSNLAVAINSVNGGQVGSEGSILNCTSLTNTAYYVDNTNGLVTQYDGYTVPLTATMVVVPCSTYHIKLVIADVGDHLYDSGVFLQAQSFSAGESVGVNATAYNNSSVNYEGCFDGNFTFFREDTNSTNPITIAINVSGSATEGVDYQSLPDSITIPAGQQNFVLPIVPVIDGIAEFPESVIITYSDGCSCNQSKSDTLIIVDNAPLLANISGPQGVCLGDGAALTATATGSLAVPYQYNWSTGDTGSTVTVRPLVQTTYTVTVTDGCGAQTTVTKTVGVGQPPAAMIVPPFATICFGDSVTLTASGGVTYSWSHGPSTAIVTVSPASTMTYFVTVTDAGGCSSLDSVTVSVNPLPVASITPPSASVCAGECVTLTASGGVTYVWSTGATGVSIQVCPLQTTNYNVTVVDINGCASTASATVSVLLPSSSNQSASICNGDSILLGGTFQTQAGTYFDTLIGANGCDSVVITELSVLSNFLTEQTAQICEGDSLLVGGAFQTESGVYYDTLISSAGCDSIIETTLSVVNTITNVVPVSICDGESYFAGGALQTQPGQYSDTFTTSFGCDSIVITDLSVLPNSLSTAFVSICQGDSFFVGGAFQTQPGIYFDTLFASVTVSLKLPSNLAEFSLTLFRLKFVPEILSLLEEHSKPRLDFITIQS